VEAISDAGGLLQSKDCSRFPSISDSRAKVGMGFGMLAGSREIVCRCVEIYISRRTDHHGLFLFYDF